MAALGAGDGDARHIAMKIIRMRYGKSISQINSYAKSNKRQLYIKIWRSPVPAGIPIWFLTSNLLTSNQRNSVSSRRSCLSTQKDEVPMGLTTDVLVVGGGPAGLAAAIAARKRGFSVVVVDGAKPPIDKACGEGLLPGTLAALRELGIYIQAGDGESFQRIRFIDGSISATANFPGDAGIGVRRTVLHQKMAARAVECGVELLWNAPVTSVTQEGAIAGGKSVRAKWVVGADGIHSRVRHWSGLHAGLNGERRFAQRRISRDSAMNVDEALREFPKLADNLRDVKLSSVQRGAVTATCRLDRVCRENIALVGDASGSVDAITGEGLGLSFRQALALADALEAGDLEKYQSAHRRLARRPLLMSRLLLLLDGCAPLRRRVLQSLAKDPDLFTGLLTAHLQDTSLRLLAEVGARLAWQLVTA
ncbi:MAG: hypothetical protein DMG37_02950 [Acidobacteria bacterium]|nr:MAG: hypothetical protein DMG37_02950 [Acidobacteriota bacterium]